MKKSPEKIILLSILTVLLTSSCYTYRNPIYNSKSDSKSDLELRDNMKIKVTLKDGTKFIGLVRMVNSESLFTSSRVGGDTYDLVTHFRDIESITLGEVDPYRTTGFIFIVSGALIAVTILAAASIVAGGITVF